MVARGDAVIGLLAIQDVPKPSSKRAIEELKARGLKTVMLTGDNQRVAQAIGDQVGIDQVIAGVLPNEKADHVRALEQGGPVAFVGDGINDAPALTSATVGIAMGSGTDVAIESGSIVLVQNDLNGVVRALDMSQKTFNRIKLNLFWALIYNLIRDSDCRRGLRGPGAAPEPGGGRPRDGLLFGLGGFLVTLTQSNQDCGSAKGSVITRIGKRLERRSLLVFFCYTDNVLPTAGLVSKYG